MARGVRTAATVHDRHLGLIKEKYEGAGADHSELWETILAIAGESSLNDALECLERCVLEKRTAWLDTNLAGLQRTADPIADAYRIFYGEYLSISAPLDGEIVERGPRRLVTRWWNRCPTLDACRKFDLDTTVVCKKAYHRPVQAFLGRIHPGLRFERNYDALRPHTPYCEEILRLTE
jgi:hypothetical protein